MKLQVIIFNLRALFLRLTVTVKLIYILAQDRIKKTVSEIFIKIYHKKKEKKDHGWSVSKKGCLPFGRNSA